MRPFPLDEAAREEIRMEQIDRMTLDAVRRASRWNVSLRCERGDHRRTDGSRVVGCRNDGSGCLCSCHDQ